MAFYSACKPTFCGLQSNKLTDSLKPNSAKKASLGKMIKVEVKPQYAEGELHGDNEIAESKKIFKYADITLNTTTLSWSAFQAMYGIAPSTVSGKTLYVDKVSDEQCFGTFSYVYGEVVDGVTKYIACLLHRVKFDLPEESYETTNDSITFGTPTISGKAYPDEKGNWRTRCEYSSLADAINAADFMSTRSTGYVVANSSDEDISLDSEGEILLASASLITSENVPDNASAVTAAANQEAVTMTNTGGSYVISGDIDSLTAYSIEGTSKKWIGVLVSTGTEDVTTVTMNSSPLGSDDVALAEECGGQAGDFVLWLDAEAISENPQVVALRTSAATADISFSFENATDNGTE